MKKKTNTPASRLKYLFTRYVWLKLISLALAIMVWLYVQGKLKI
jgi:hypothetical protein